MIIDDTLRGRLGTYVVRVYDTENFSRDTLRCKLAGDIEIKYGELDRRPSKSILPTYTQLSFVDEFRDLYSEFKGGFRNDRYVVEIFDKNGSDVRWRGLVKEEARVVPVNNRTSKNTTTINCYGGIKEGRINEQKAKQRHGNAPSNVGMPITGSYMLSRATKQVPIRSIGSNGDFGGGEYIRSNVEFSEPFSANSLPLGDTYDFDIPDNDFRYYPTPLDTFQSDSFYDAIKDYNKVYKGIIFKSLSEGKVVWDQRTLIGAESSEIKASSSWPQKDNYVMTSRQSFINIIEDPITGRGKDGFRDLKQIGEINIRFEQQENVLHIGPIVKNATNPEDTSVDYINDNLGNAQVTGKERDSYIDVRNIDVDNGSTVDFRIGPYINPENAIGGLVTWEEPDKVEEVQFRFNDSNNTIVKETDPQNNLQIKADAIKDDIYPRVRIKLKSADSGGSSASVKIKCRLLTIKDDIIQTLLFGSTEKGIEPIEIENPPNPSVTYYSNNDTSGSLFDQTLIYEAQQINKKDKADDENNSHLYQANQERELRPPGTRTLRTRMVGIYGPEYVHKIDDNDNDVFDLFIATGLKISLKEGITDASLVEIPNHALS